MTEPQVRPNVLIMGGEENALSLVRSLSKYDIKIYLTASDRCAANHSRFVTRTYPYAEGQYWEFWQGLLLAQPVPELRDCIVLTCGDEAIEFVAQNHDALKGLYRLEANPPDVRLSLLRKDESSAIAQAAGIAVPKYKIIGGEEDIAEVLEHWMLPLIVKPVMKHRKSSSLASNILLLDRRTEIEEVCNQAVTEGVSLIVCEDIPGPDNLLCSYYTYVDETGEPAFHFTKRIIRRFPVHFGSGVYHITEWLPDVAGEGLKFFRQAGLRGLGNVEFKRDERDGKLKFIECNARFTAAQEQLVQCGYDLAEFVYRTLAGLPVELPARYREGVRFWYPRRDFKAYRQLSEMGQITVLEWLRSVAHRQVFPVFRWSDPGPAVCLATSTCRRVCHRIAQRILSLGRFRKVGQA